MSRCNRVSYKAMLAAPLAFFAIAAAADGGAGNGQGNNGQGDNGQGRNAGGFSTIAPPPKPQHGAIEMPGEPPKRIAHMSHGHHNSHTFQIGMDPSTGKSNGGNNQGGNQQGNQQ